jgi:hypothetical protein
MTVGAFLPGLHRSVPGALCLLLLLPLGWPTGAAGQGAAGRPSPEVVACAGANKQAYGELAAAHEQGLRSHRLQPLVVTRLQGLGPQVTRLRDATQKTPRNLAECEQTTQALAAASEQLERIVGSPAQVAECTAAQRQAQADAMTALQAAQKAGAASPGQLASLGDRLEALAARLARDNLTLSDCRQLGTEVAEERAQLQRLAPPPPPAQAVVAAPAASTPAQCREAHGRTYNDLAQTYARVVGAGPIAPEAVAPLQALSQRLTQLHGLIGNPGATGLDCAAVGKALEQARSELATLVRR